MSQSSEHGSWWSVDTGSTELVPGSGSEPRLLADAVLSDALSALNDARTAAGAASACARLLAAQPGVRAVAVVVRHERRVTIVGSAGYDCGTMLPGAELPLDAGLPVTEAVRTGRTVAQGTGPGWVALPFSLARRRRGALLLSLDGPPPSATADLARLLRLAGALGATLARCSDAERGSATLAAVRAELTAGSHPVAGCPAVLRARCAQDGVGGDTGLCLPDGRGGIWLVAADVVGYGVVAALLARSVRAAARAAAPWARGPADLLLAVERGILDDVPPGSFVTALVVHVDAKRRLSAATAGHPPALVLKDGVAAPLAVEPGPPLALEASGGEGWAETHAVLPPGATVLLHTDGLTERRVGDGVRLLDPARLATGLPDDLEAAADRLLDAADAAGRAEDDVTVLLARP